MTSIEEMAEWVAGSVAGLGLRRVHVVGHSMGTFIALELASRHPHLTETITLCATAAAMPVHPDLLAAAHDDVPAAAAMMAAWGHARPARAGATSPPGSWLITGPRSLVKSAAPGALASDLMACAQYTAATVAAAAVTCPATVIIGLGDKMTPPRSGRALAAAFPAAHVVELANTGHFMLSGNARAVNRALLAALRV